MYSNNMHVHPHVQQPPPYYRYHYRPATRMNSGSSTGASSLVNSPPGYNDDSDHHFRNKRRSTHRKSPMGRWWILLWGPLIIGIITLRMFGAWIAPISSTSALDHWDTIAYLADHPTGGRVPALETIWRSFWWSSSTGKVPLRSIRTDPATGTYPWVAGFTLGALPAWFARLAVPMSWMNFREFRTIRGVLCLLTAVSEIHLSSAISQFFGSPFLGVATLVLSASAPCTFADAGSFGAPLAGTFATLSIAAFLSGNSKRSLLAASMAICLTGLGLWAVLPLFPVALGATLAMGVFRGTLSAIIMIVTALLIAGIGDFWYHGKDYALEAFYGHFALDWAHPPIMDWLAQLERGYGVSILLLAGMGFSAATLTVLRLRSPSLHAVGGRLSLRTVLFLALVTALPLSLLSAAVAGDQAIARPFLTLAAVVGLGSWTAPVGRDSSSSIENGLLGETSHPKRSALVGTVLRKFFGGLTTVLLIFAAAAPGVIFGIVPAMKTGQGQFDQLNHLSGSTICVSNVLVPSFLLPAESSLGFVTPYRSRKIGTWTSESKTDQRVLPIPPLGRLGECESVLGPPESGSDSPSNELLEYSKAKVVGERIIITAPHELSRTLRTLSCEDWPEQSPGMSLLSLFHVVRHEQRQRVCLWHLGPQSPVRPL